MSGKLCSTMFICHSCTMLKSIMMEKMPVEQASYEILKMIPFWPIFKLYWKTLIVKMCLPQKLRSLLLCSFCTKKKRMPEHEHCHHFIIFKNVICNYLSHWNKFWCTFDPMPPNENPNEKGHAMSKHILTLLAFLTDGCFCPSKVLCLRG